MADNFDMKKFLVENKLGAYSKLKEDEGNPLGDFLYQYELDISGDVDDETKDQLYSLKTLDDVKKYYGDERGWLDDKDFKRDFFNLIKTLKAKFPNLKETEEGYMGTQYDSSEDMAVDMVKKGITEEPVEEASQGTLMAVSRIEEIVSNLARNISTNSNIPTQEKIGLVQALKELKDLVEDLGADVEMGMSEAKKPVEEALSPDYIDRMEGLANIQNLAIFKDKLKSLASDWMKEGFDKEDVVEYIDYVLNSSVNETKEPVEEAASTRDIAMALGSDEPDVDSLVLRFLQGISKKFGLSMFQTTLLVKERIKKLGY